MVLPLNNLVAASERIEQGQFDTPAPDTALPNELGQLSHAFNHMSAELHTLYRSLEHSVAEKTQHLNEAHQQLEMLFKCSQALNTGQIDSHSFRHILQIVHEYTQMNYLGATNQRRLAAMRRECVEECPTAKPASADAGYPVW